MSIPTPFSQFQFDALNNWVENMADKRLQILQQQLFYAIGAFDPNSGDDYNAYLALIARQNAVCFQLAMRGPLPPLDLIVVPWGTSKTSFTMSTLTNYTKLPPKGDFDGLPQDAGHPLDFLDQPADPMDVQNSATDPTTLDPTDQSFFRIPDTVNDFDEVENFRMADGDYSGLPIISCEVIEVGLLSSHTPVASTNFLADNGAQGGLPEPMIADELFLPQMPDLILAPPSLPSTTQEVDPYALPELVDVPISPLQQPESANYALSAILPEQPRDYFDEHFTDDTDLSWTGPVDSERPPLSQEDALALERYFS